MTDQIFVPESVAALEEFARAGVLGEAEIHVATTFAGVDQEAGFEALLAAALAVRAPLHGSVCVDLARVRDTVVSSFESTAQLATAQSGGEAPGDEHAGDDDVRVHSGDSELMPVLGSLPWPDPYVWLARVRESPLVLQVDESGETVGPEHLLRPLVLDGGLLYLHRYWSLERYVAADLRERSRSEALAPSTGAHPPAGMDISPVGPAPVDYLRFAGPEVRRLFDAAASEARPVDEGQLGAALGALERDFVVISGGPGTGKTTTVAKLLAGIVTGLESEGIERQIALVAPTGKASARMTEAIRRAVGELGDALEPSSVEYLRGLEATTIHRLLGSRGGAGFRHGPENPLPHDIVIVDEVSMVSLSLMAHLLAAVRAGAKVVLVGDPYQLASVEAGSVLGDVVGIAAVGADDPNPEPPAAIRDSVMTLRTVHRQDAGSAILELAEVIRQGRPDDVIALLRTDHPDITWIDPDGPGGGPRLAALEAEITDAARSAVDAARAADIEAALRSIGGVKVLCALRRGPGGVEDWNRRVEVALRSGGTIGPGGSYSGRPVMVTRNDYVNRVFNGDVGVAVRRDDRYEVWFPEPNGARMVEEVRVDDSVTQWAMSIHKSQGSEFPHTVVALPPPPSRILTRELLYTGVTRAKERLTLIAGEAAIRSAVQRRIARASGLNQRLRRQG